MNPSYSATFIVCPLLKSIDEKTCIRSFHDNRAIKNANRSYPVGCVCLWNGPLLLLLVASFNIIFWCLRMWWFLMCKWTVDDLV